MLFRERLILSLEQNKLSHFFTDMDPFGGQYIKVGVTKFLYFLFMCLKNGPKSKNLKNTWEKSIILACHTDFALISTIFVRCGYNFTWITTMKVPFLHILLTNLRKSLKKSLLRLKVKISLISAIFVLI